ncbi:hypothetical protein FHX82_004559 [Amycolatopsis bartoniae]|nr:hypothetical protein [Amycolatopsis bartoniae]
MEDEFLRDIRQWLLQKRVDQALEPEEPWIPLPRTPLD